MLLRRPGARRARCACRSPTGTPSAPITSLRRAWRGRRASDRRVARARRARAGWWRRPPACSTSPSPASCVGELRVGGGEHVRLTPWRIWAASSSEPANESGPWRPRSACRSCQRLLQRRGGGHAVSFSRRRHAPAARERGDDHQQREHRYVPKHCIGTMRCAALRRRERSLDAPAAGRGDLDLPDRRLGLDAVDQRAGARRTPRRGAARRRRRSRAARQRHGAGAVLDRDGAQAVAVGLLGGDRRSFACAISA